MCECNHKFVVYVIEGQESKKKRRKRMKKKMKNSSLLVRMFFDVLIDFVKYYFSLLTFACQVGSRQTEKPTSNKFRG